MTTIAVQEGEFDRQSVLAMVEKAEWSGHTRAELASPGSALVIAPSAVHNAIAAGTWRMDGHTLRLGRSGGAITVLAATICASVLAMSGVLAGAQRTAGASPRSAGIVSSGVSGCGLKDVAFCDTFTDDPPGDGNRSGGLNGVVWGVSRESGAFNNLGQGQYDSAVNVLQMTGSCPTRAATIQTDIEICNGQVNDVVNDNPTVNPSNEDQLGNGNGTVTSLAMYPKQPFDFAGRTGKVVFDVSDNSGGSHAAWPELWITNAPDPDPFAHLATWQSLPQYGFGIRLDGVCSPRQGGNCGPHCASTNTGYVVTVNDAITVDNYVENDPENGGDLKVVRAGCVTEPTRPGELNHFEIDVSQREITVYGTNAGTSSPLVLLATVPDADLGFTRGLIWLEDVHYNANKGIDQVPQAMHTFTWDDVGFDGPVLPRDLAFDAADSLTRLSGYPTLTNLGWLSTPSSPASIPVPGVSGMSKATGALLTFNFFNPDTAPVDISYSIDGHATQVFKWPYPDTMTDSPRTLAIPFPLAEVVKGTNHVKIWSAQDELIISNVDLVLQGAGGIVEPRPV